MKIGIIKDNDGYYKKYTNGNKYVTTTLYSKNGEYIGCIGKYPNYPIPMETQIAVDISLSGGTLVYTKD